MIVRTRTLGLTPGSLPQAIDWLHNTELPILKGAPGCTGILVLASTSDTANPRLELITRWDTVQSLNSSDAAIDQRLQRLPGLAGPIEIGTYEVALAAGVIGGTVARYIAAHLHANYIDHVVSIFENVVMHAATEQRGFRRGLLLVDRAANRATSIGLWLSEDDLLASERVGYLGQQIGNFTQIVAAPIAPEILTVAVEWDAGNA